MSVQVLRRRFTAVEVADTLADYHREVKLPFYSLSGFAGRLTRRHHCETNC